MTSPKNSCGQGAPRNRLRGLCAMAHWHIGQSGTVARYKMYCTRLTHVRRWFTGFYCLLTNWWMTMYIISTVSYKLMCHRPCVCFVCTSHERELRDMEKRHIHDGITINGDVYINCHTYSSEMKRRRWSRWDSPVILIAWFPKLTITVPSCCKYILYSPENDVIYLFIVCASVTQRHGERSAIKIAVEQRFNH